MGIFIRLQFTNSLLLFLLSCHISYGQDSSRKLYFGLDISKNVPPLFNQKEYFFQESFIIEPSVWIPMKKGEGYISIMLGYSSIHANPIYKNLNYHNQGLYLKTGVEYVLESYFSVGTGPILSLYDEFGNYLFEGPYFGSVEVPFTPRRLAVLAWEFHAAPRISIGDRFFINFVFRSSLNSLNITRKNRPESYYVPGVGAISRDFTNFTGGLSVNVQYAVPIK